MDERGCGSLLWTLGLGLLLAGLPKNALAQDLVDLEATDLLTPLSAPVGVPFTATVELLNSGSADAGPFEIRVYGDGSPGVEVTDQYFGRAIVPGLAAGASVSVDLEVKSPGNYHAEVYYMAVFVDWEDDVEEINEDNNDYQGPTMTFTPSADLDLRAFAAPASAAAGAVMTLRATLGNEGFGDVSNFEIGFYLSDNNEITGNDTRIYNTYFGLIHPGEGDDVFWSFVIPPETPIGSYTLGILLDDTQTIDELDETNNYATQPFQIRQSTGRLAFVSPPRVVLKNGCSAAIVFQRETLDGTPAVPANDLVVKLFRRSSSMYLYDEASCNHESSVALLSAATNRGQFFMRSTATGGRRVEIGAQDLLAATQTQLIAEDPSSGTDFLEIHYSLRSKNVVVGQTAKLDLGLVVRSPEALTGAVLQLTGSGLKTLAVDGVPVSEDGGLSLGLLEAGKSYDYVVEVAPLAGHLQARSAAAIGFSLESSGGSYELLSEELNLQIQGHNGLAECSSGPGADPMTWLLIFLPLLPLPAGWRRRR